MRLVLVSFSPFAFSPLAVSHGKLWNQEGCGTTKLCILRSICKNPSSSDETLRELTGEDIKDECTPGMIVRPHSQGRLQVQLWTEGKNIIMQAQEGSNIVECKENVTDTKSVKIVHEIKDNLLYCRAVAPESFFDDEYAMTLTEDSKVFTVSKNIPVKTRFTETDFAQACSIGIPTFDDSCGECLPKENLLFLEPPMEFKCDSGSTLQFKLLSDAEWQEAVTVKCVKRVWTAMDAGDNDVAALRKEFHLRCAQKVDIATTEPDEQDSTIANDIAKKEEEPKSDNSKTDVLPYAVGGVVLVVIIVIVIVVVVLIVRKVCCKKKQPDPLPVTRSTSKEAEQENRAHDKQISQFDVINDMTLKTLKKKVIDDAIINFTMHDVDPDHCFKGLPKQDSVLLFEKDSNGRYVAFLEYENVSCFDCGVQLLPEKSMSFKAEPALTEMEMRGDTARQKITFIQGKNKDNKKLSETKLRLEFVSGGYKNAMNAITCGIVIKPATGNRASKENVTKNEAEATLERTAQDETEKGKKKSKEDKEKEKPKKKEKSMKEEGEKKKSLMKPL